VSADFIIGGSFKPPPDEEGEEEEEEEKEEDENRDAIVFVVCAPPRAGEDDDDDDDDERPLRDFPKPLSLLRINARFQNSPPLRLLLPPALFPPDELNASAPNFPSSTNRIILKVCLNRVLL